MNTIKTLLTGAVVVSALSLGAQKLNLNTAASEWKSGMGQMMSAMQNGAEPTVAVLKFKEAYENIKLAMVHEETVSNAKTWLYVGRIYSVIGGLKAMDSSLVDFATETPEEMSEISINAYKKCVELDSRGKYTYDVEQDFAQAINQFNMLGNKAYEEQDFKTAYEAFAGIAQLNAILGKANADQYYNAGLCAYNAEMYDESIEYMDNAIKATPEIRSYKILISSYSLKQDYDKASEVAEKALELFPNDQAILTSLAQIYINKGDNEGAIKVLEGALSNDPDNVILINAVGITYQNLGMDSLAIVNFEKILAKNPNDHEANRSIGSVYFNQAAETYTEAGNELNPGKYNMLKEKFTAEFKKAAPYLEKAAETSPDDATKNALLGNLVQLYGKIGDSENMARIQAMING